VRNACLLLATTDKLRACLETTAKVLKTMHDHDPVNLLYDAIIKEIAKESPAVADRILRQVSAVAARWT